MEKILREIQNPINWYLCVGFIAPLVFYFLSRKKTTKPLLEATLLGISIGYLSAFGGYVAFIYWISLLGLYSFFLFRKDWSYKTKITCLVLNIVTSAGVYFLIWQSLRLI